MKPLTTLAALLVASCIAVPLVLAQETETPTSSSPGESAESTPATKSTDKSSTDKSETSKSYPTPGASPKSGASAAAKESPSPAAKASASPAAKGSASPAAKAAATAKPLTGSPESQIRQIEDAYEAAIMAHNAALVEPYMADDFVLTDSKNRVMSKRAAITEFKKDTDTYTTAKNSDMKVRMVDKDVYVVTGMAREAGKDKAGKPFDRRFRFTDTFVNRKGKWMVVATHASLVSGR